MDACCLPPWNLSLSPPPPLLLPALRVTPLYSTSRILSILKVRRVELTSTPGLNKSSHGWSMKPLLFVHSDCVEVGPRNYIAPTPQPFSGRVEEVLRESGKPHLFYFGKGVERGKFPLLQIVWSGASPQGRTQQTRLVQGKNVDGAETDKAPKLPGSNQDWRPHWFSPGFPPLLCVSILHLRLWIRFAFIIQPSIITNRIHNIFLFADWHSKAWKSLWLIPAALWGLLLRGAFALLCCRTWFWQTM